MSTDPLPTTSYTPVAATSTYSSVSVHIPVAILGLALAVFMVVQIRGANATSVSLRKQISNAEGAQKNLKDLEKQYKDVLDKRVPVMQQAQEVQKKHQAFINDLLELAKEDSDAKRVVDAHIRVEPGAAAPGATPAAGMPAAAPAATPAPKP